MNEMSTRSARRLAVIGSLVGLLFAAVTISGTLPDATATRRTATALLALLGVAAGVLSESRPFGWGAFAGFVAGFVAIETQALFLPTYFANNPQYSGLEMPFGWSPRFATAVLGPLNAIVAGVFSGAIAATMGFARRRIAPPG